MSDFSKKTTLREYIDRFMHYAETREGFLSDDYTLSKKAVAKDLLAVRAKLLKREHSSGDLNITAYQELPCVEFTLADPMKCPCRPPSGCYWLESCHEIPEFIAISHVVSTTASREFTMKGWKNLKESLGGRSKMGKKDFYTFRKVGKNVKLVILTDQHLKDVTLEGIAVRPYEFCSFPKCGKVDIEALCNPLDQEFAFPSDLDEELFLFTMQEIYRMRAVAKRDLKNNDLADEV